MAEKPLFARLILEEKDLWIDIVKAIYKAREKEKLLGHNSQVLRDLDKALELSDTFWEDTQEMVKGTVQECSEVSNSLNLNRLRRPNERSPSSLSQSSISSVQSNEHIENQPDSAASSNASKLVNGSNHQNLTPLQNLRDKLNQYRIEKRVEKISETQSSIAPTQSLDTGAKKTTSIQDRLLKVRSEPFNSNDQERLQNTLSQLLIADQALQNSNKINETNKNTREIYKRENNYKKSFGPPGPRPTRCWNCSEFNHNFTQCKQPLREFCHYCGKKNVKTKECICSQKK